MEMKVGKLAFDRPIVDIARSRLLLAAFAAVSHPLGQSHPLKPLLPYLPPPHKFREERTTY